MDRNKVFENNGRISVLAGKKKIDDMLVFLAYKKVKRTLAGPSLHRTKLSERDRKE